ncbi:MAG: 16S rRNA (cytidine(1402)-2'-O)-methyltransferase [Candidatus Kerfeldbacteria bacterium]|nr:16S rRNA (cytidine(1402)-2'-O)-methyltransferase [Candidatus Kerfeldbacteria bacterium]
MEQNQPISQHQTLNHKQGILFVVATPIGNLGDVSGRALETLTTADVVVCEDTRVTKKLLDRYNVQARLLSVHQHSSQARITEVIGLLRNGKTVALVADAGTPGVSDPGGMLAAAAYDAGVKVVAVPGPSAVTAALSVSGLPTDRFTFLGWLPHKKGRQTMLQALVDSSYTIIFFESPHRIMKTLERLKELLDDGRMVVVCRELTKVFEETVRGSAGYVYDVFANNPGKVRGEFVVVVGPPV